MKAVISLVVVAGIVVGCGGPRTPKMPRPPAQAPAPPKRVELPIDPALRARAEAELSAAFGSRDAFIRANAVEATQRTLGEAGRERILQALEDPSPIVRFAGAVAAGTLRLEEAHQTLRILAMPGVDDKTRDRALLDIVRVGAIYGLHRLGDYRQSHELEKLAMNDDPRVRANVVMVLGLLGEPSGLNILKSMKHEFSPAVQLQALEARYRLGDPDAKEKLVAGTVSSAPDDQIVSLLALAGPRDPSVAPVLRSKLTSDYPEVSLAAARALGMIGNDTGMGVALKYVSAPDEVNEARDPTSNQLIKVNVGANRRAMAALALGEIGRTDAQPQLEKLLKDPNVDVRLAAATAILQLRPLGQ